MPGGIHPPLSVIASWPTPNYIDPQTRPKTLVVLAAVFGSISLLFLCARLWARLIIQHNAGLDDWLMVAAMAPIIVLTVLIPVSSEVYGFNKHVWDVVPTYFVTERKYVLAIEIVFVLASGIVKVSILLFYRRLGSRSISRAFRYTTWISIVIILMYSVAFVLAPLLACRPFSAYWDQSNFTKLAQGYKFHCFNEGADVFSAAVISATLDLITTLLPTLLYANLRIPTRQKVALFGIFAIGYCVSAIGFLRAYFTYRVFFSTYDVTWEIWNSLTWTLTEIHIGAMCANAPSLKVFFGHYFTVTASKLSSSKSSSAADIKNSQRSRRKSPEPAKDLELSNISKPPKALRNGYMSEPHSEIVADEKGQIYLSRSGSDCRLTVSSANIFQGRCDPVHPPSEGLEMGDVQALPPICAAKTPRRPWWSGRSSDRSSEIASRMV